MNITPTIKALECLRQIGIGLGLPGDPTEEFYLAEAAIAQVRSMAQMRTSNFADVWQFNMKFKVPHATQPSLLDPATLEFRAKHLQEELDEFKLAHEKGDLEEAADALIDLVYVAMGAAYSMGLPWQLLWDELQRANMQKERATHESQSKRGSTLDIIKPEGWQPPNHRKALGLVDREGLAPWEDQL